MINLNQNDSIFGVSIWFKNIYMIIHGIVVRYRHRRRFAAHCACLLQQGLREHLVERQGTAQIRLQAVQSLVVKWNTCRPESVAFLFITSSWHCGTVQSGWCACS